MCTQVKSPKCTRMQVYAGECTYRHVNGVQEVASSNLAAPIAETVVNSSRSVGPEPMRLWAAATLGCYIPSV